MSPIVIISNYSEISWLKNGFNAGASDYLIKPFRLQELELRIIKWFKIYLCTIRFYNTEEINYCELKYNFQDNEFYYKNKKIILNKKNKYILSIFISKYEKIISESILIEKIWGDRENIINRNLRIVILRLKKSLKKIGIESWLQNIRGEGYILKKN